MKFSYEAQNKKQMQSMLWLGGQMGWWQVIQPLCIVPLKYFLHPGSQYQELPFSDICKVFLLFFSCFDCFGSFRNELATGEISAIIHPFFPSAYG